MQEQKTKSWLTDEIRFYVTIGTIIVSITLAWASLQTKQAVTDERLNVIENNHLTHLQAYYEQNTKDIQTIREAIVRIQTTLDDKK